VAVDQARSGFEAHDSRALSAGDRPNSLPIIRASLAACRQIRQDRYWAIVDCSNTDLGAG
jgi:hypothetical protein